MLKTANSFKFFLYHFRSSSKIYFSGNGRDDYYTLASTPIPLSETMGNAAGMIASHNNSGISTPLSIAVQQQTQMLQTNQQQSPMPPQAQSNVPSVLYTVQRVITTSQIQSTEMLECTSSAATTYQTHSHQMMSHQMQTDTQPNANYYNAPSNSVPNNTVNRPLQSVGIPFFCENFLFQTYNKNQRHLW